MVDLKNNVSVVLPSYNEKDNVPKAVERIDYVLGDDLLEIVVVDDNSPDLTWKIVEDLHHPKVRVIRRVNEKGLASALADGIASTKGKYVVWMDCDLGLPPEDIPRLLEKLDNYDVVIGSRYAKDGKDTQKKIRVIGSLVMNKFAQLLLGNKVTDYTSGFVAARKDAIEDIKWDREGFGEYFIEFAYRCVKKGLRVTEVGYTYKDREIGVSTIGASPLTLIKYGLQYGMKILRLRFK